MDEQMKGNVWKAISHMKDHVAGLVKVQTSSIEFGNQVAEGMKTTTIDVLIVVKSGGLMVLTLRASTTN